ncbi:MAG: peptidyl-prolyl cis-trans isomerase [Candidatus Omnitrophica bacterium]|nr:peptidyl-prolyl cis-trans isomerase [Candidatus Omnitrophota bacterium]
MNKIKNQESKIKIITQKLKFFVLSYGFTFCVLAFTLSCFAQDKIVAIVNNDIITQKDLNDFINFMRMQLSAEYKEAELENKVESIKSDLLDRLIEDRIILQEAKKDKLEIDGNKVKEKIDQIKRRYVSDREFQDALSQQGLVQADLESRIREQLLMYNIIDTRIRREILIKPGEVTDFYQQNLEEFRIPEQREFNFIIVADKDLSREVFNNLKDNQDFAGVAKKYSLAVEKSSAKKGQELREDIERAIFTLNLGESSEPTEIEDSFYIFKLVNIIPSRQQVLSEAQDRIYAFLFEMKMQEGLTRWLGGLKEHSYIKILED